MPASSDAGGTPPHTSVLYQQVLAALQPERGGQYIDGTLGAGGHAVGLLDESAPDGQLIGLDLDQEALELARQRLAVYGDRVHLFRRSYAEMDQIVAQLGWDGVDGIVLDLGLSSMQVDEPERGFSFRGEGPLDMRFDQSQGGTASDLVNGLSQSELERILREYGEVRRAGHIARAIVEARPIHTTRQLADVVARAARPNGGRIHPATRTFQALRIAVNQELETLAEGLEAGLKVLRPEGRMAVISFHSLEDRLVKQFFRRESRDCLCPPKQPICTCGHTATMREITRKPITPDRAEQRANPRSRSAKLRVAERLSLA